MLLDPLFVIIALLSIGKKLEILYSAWKEKNKEQIKVQSFFLLIIILTIVIVYIGVFSLNKD